MSVLVPERPHAPPATIAHRRSSSNADVSTVRPPCYSSLEGALPPLSAPSSDEAYDSPPPAPAPQDTPTAARRPPRYSRVFDRTRERRRDHTRARGHGASGAPQLHEYHLSSSSGGGSRGGQAPYATLRVYSRASAAPAKAASPYAAGGDAARVPKFVGAELVQGALDLSFDPPQNVNSISLCLRGRLVTSSYDGGTHTFLDQPIASWTRANGDPRAMLLAPLADAARAKKFEGKLAGSYSWPFSFPFPQEVKAAGDARASHTPQTFAEKHIRASVQYELVLRMSHGILRSDSKLHVPLVYVPEITPPPSSTLRQIAYGENIGAPGPEVDPVGWHALPPTTIRGNIFRERTIKLQCTLSLANPLTYTRGTVIPCHIALESSDTQGLDALATPRALALRLVRRVQYFDDAAAPAQSSRPRAAGDRAGGAVVEVATEVASAVWWVNAEAALQGALGPRRRALEGEIHLEKDLQPSCTYALLRVSYAVELLPFATPVFQLVKGSGSSSPTFRKSAEETLVSHPITIATVHSEGPTPVAFTQPAPRSSKKIQARTISPGSSVIAGVSAYL